MPLAIEEVQAEIASPPPAASQAAPPAAPRPHDLVARMLSRMAERARRLHAD
jgi:hypothetical protein